MPTMVGKVPIFVVNGPHCLLGSPTLQKLWPQEYNGLSDIAKQSLNAVNMYNATTVKSGPAATNVAMVSAAATPITSASSAPNFAQHDTEHDRDNATGVIYLHI